VGILGELLRLRKLYDAPKFNFFIFLGVILSMGILSYYFKLSDPVVGFVSGISQFSSCFLYAFATTSLMMYLGKLKGTVLIDVAARGTDQF